MITINFFPNSRLEFFPLIFHFIKKIKDENKKKISLNILTTNKDYNFFIKYKNENPDLEINLIVFNEGFNYTEKLRYVLELNHEYSIKIDEDCIVNNYIWDYLIENCSSLNDENNLLISPLLSTSFPSCEDFIRGFLTEEQRKYIYNCFLTQPMPNGLFNVNYEPLNKYTINANEWIPENYYKGLLDLPTETKGLHPMRISYNAQTKLNDFIIENYEKLLTKNDYSLYEIDAPYFTINMFMIKTNIWKKIYYMYGGHYDEIPISNYKRNNNKKFLFVKNGYGVHTMYNTIYDNKNKWNIGGTDSQEKEIKFVETLSKLIL